MAKMKEKEREKNNTAKLYYTRLKGKYQGILRWKTFCSLRARMSTIKNTVRVASLISTAASLLLNQKMCVWPSKRWQRFLSLMVS